MIEWRIGTAIEELRLRFLALRQEKGHGRLHLLLPPAGHAKMVGMHVREHDFFDIAGSEVERMHRRFPLRAGFGGVQAGIEQGPAIFAAQEVAIDDVQLVGQGDLHLYDVVGDLCDAGLAHALFFVPSIFAKPPCSCKEKACNFV